MTEYIEVHLIEFKWYRFPPKDEWVDETGLERNKYKYHGRMIIKVPQFTRSIGPD